MKHFLCQLWRRFSRKLKIWKSNIYDGTFCENSYRHLAINYFRKKLNIWCLIGLWMHLWIANYRKFSFHESFSGPSPSKNNVTHWCSMKKLFWKISGYSRENTCLRACLGLRGLATRVVERVKSLCV